MLSKISLLAAAALVAGSFGYAAAQSSPGAPGAAGGQTKCWDAATKQIKDKSAMKDGAAGTAGSGSAAPGPRAGGATSGSGAAGSQPSSPSANADRPPQAVGLPNC